MIAPPLGRPSTDDAPPPTPPPRVEADRRRQTVRTSRVVVRRIDPWSVLKLSLLFYLSVCLVLLVAGVLLWTAASSTGIIDNLEGFVEDIGWEDFRFLPGQILRGAGVAGLVLVVAGTFGNVLMAVLYNLIGDVVGGIKLTLAEDAPGRQRS